MGTLTPSPVTPSPLTPSPWLQTGSRKAFDLIHPTPDMVDLVIDVAPALARIPRFTGHAGGYSVAQHCAVGADMLLDRTGDPALALAFLLHDAHEAYLGDIATPIQEAIALIAEYEDYVVEGGVPRAIRELKRRADVAIYAAAGTTVPTGAAAAAVHEMDRIMLATEARDLLGGTIGKWPVLDGIEPLPQRLVIWSAEDAAREWLKRLAFWGPMWTLAPLVHARET